MEYDYSLDKFPAVMAGLYEELNNIKSLLMRGLDKPKEPQDRCYLNDALEVTGLSKSKIYKLTAAGEIPCSQFGSRLVFSRKALLAWVERQTKPKHDHSEAVTQLARSARRKGGRS